MALWHRCWVASGQRNLSVAVPRALFALLRPASLPAFQWHDGHWKIPELENLVVYEMHVEEFNSTFQGVVDQLPYLKSLGVTCLELMPVTSLKLDFDWGYGPLHFLAPNDRWGGPAGLKHLVDGCHSQGVAVILDVVFQHVDTTFPYYQVYIDAGVPSPMIGGLGPFGPVVDYGQQFARDYVHTVTSYLLDEYHVDGFRYDEVTDLYDGPFLTGNQQNPYNPLADRSRWYKIQPFIIAQYTASGIPMLWQGQEFSENYVLAGDGTLRIGFRRDAHWEYFYDPDGSPLIRLHRILGKLRADHPALRGRDSFYYNQTSHTSSGIIGYRRSAGNDLALVFLNFSDTPQTMTIPFPSTATFREQIDAADRPAPLDLSGAATGDPMTVTVPANYGYVFTPIP